jgi:hypothetical protein
MLVSAAGLYSCGAFSARVRRFDRSSLASREYLVVLAFLPGFRQRLTGMHFFWVDCLVALAAACSVWFRGLQ